MKTEFNWHPVTEKPEDGMEIVMLCTSGNKTYVRQGEYYEDKGFGIFDELINGYDEYAGDEFISYNDECIGWIYYRELIPAELRKEN